MSLKNRKKNATQYNSTNAHSYKVVMFIHKLNHFCNTSSPDDGFTFLWWGWAECKMPLFPHCPWGCPVVVFVAVLAIVAAVVDFLIAATAGDDGPIVGSAVVVFFSFFFLVTWFHPSSGLFGWFHGSRVLPAFSLLFLLMVVLVMVLAAALCG